jgi:AcrR family transcriptional regulator
MQVAERTATLILESAARALAESDDATMDEIATAAGVGRATVYRHFPSREALLAALVGEAIDETARRFGEANLDDIGVEEAIARITRALLTVGDMYAVLVRERVQGDPDAMDRKLRAPVRRVFVRGQREGTLRADLDVDVLIDLYGGVLSAALRLPDARRLGVEEAAAAAVDLFFDGARA